MTAAVSSETPRVLVLTPVKDAERWLASHFAGLAQLSYPAELLSVGLLESDSRDGTRDRVRELAQTYRGRWNRLVWGWRDWGFRIPTGRSRHAHSLQVQRRRVLAASRNALLRLALRDEDWVLWLDVDVIEYPKDLIEQLLAYDRDILNPICTRNPGGLVYDLNAWREQGRVRMEDLRDGGRELEPLDAVGGACLWIRADCHRRGLRFPEEPYCTPLARDPNPWGLVPPGELETEGLGLMARAMGWQPWGLPQLEVVHG